MGAALGVTSSVIKRLETGTNHPDLTVGQLARLADLLAVDIVDVITKPHRHADPPDDAPIDEPAADDDTAIVGALLAATKILTPTTAIAEATGWTLPRVHAALDALADRLPATGHRLRRQNSLVAIARAVTDDDTDRIKAALRTHLARNGVSASEVRLLRHIHAGTVPKGLGNAESVAHGVLANAQLITSDDGPRGASPTTSATASSSTGRAGPPTSATIPSCRPDTVSPGHAAPVSPGERAVNLRPGVVLACDDGPMRRRHTPYAQRLGEQLDDLAARFDEMLDASSILADTLNSPGSDIVVIGAAPWRWGPSSPEVSLLRMQITGDYADWFHRVDLLFPHPTREVAGELRELDEFVRKWLDRGSNDFLVPSTIAEAKAVAAGRWDRFRALLAMVTPAGGSALRLIPDTNSLIRNPDFATYGRPFGDDVSFTVHLVTTVIGEIDKLKDQGRTAELQDKARGVNRRMKGLRDKGRLSVGVALTKKITVKAEAKEVDVRGTLDWLDPAVNDDRIAAAALRLQSDHPGDTVVLITSDLGLQNKADTIGLPYEETPPTTKDLQAKLEPSVAWAPGTYASYVLKLTIANNGRATARDVTFSITSAPGGTMTYAGGPWGAEMISNGRSAVETVGTVFTDEGIVRATWNDDDGDHEDQWTVKAGPPPPRPLTEPPSSGYR